MGCGNHVSHFLWLDTVIDKSLLESSTFVEIIEKHQNLKFACLKGISYIKWAMSQRKN